MQRPWNGACPNCGERMVVGMHWTSWLAGLMVGVTGFAIWMIWR